MDEAIEPHRHEYRTGLRWAGATGAGYEHYDRTHTVWADDDIAPLTLSADPVFGGRDELLNPERLVVLAASSCQMLSFLALAARARIDVISYVDDALGVMPERDSRPMSMETIVLRPRIGLSTEVPSARVQRLVELAHQECYVANSLHTVITVEATFTVAGGRESGSNPAR